MLSTLGGPDDASLEQCVDDMDAFVETLGRYPEAVLAFALRAHLGALLRAMAERHSCSREEVRQFLVELEREALGVD